MHCLKTFVWSSWASNAAIPEIKPVIINAIYFLFALNLAHSHKGGQMLQPRECAALIGTLSWLMP